MKPYRQIEEECVADFTETRATSALQAFGLRIVRLRRRKGWSRVELAGELGVSRDRLAKWERGAHEPPLAMLIVLRRVLGVSLDELVAGAPPAAKEMTEAERSELRAHAWGLARFLDQTLNERGPAGLREEGS